MTFFLMETAPARISPAPMYKCAAAFFVFHRSRDCCIPRVLHSRGTLGLDRVRSKEFFFWNSFFLLFFSPKNSSSAARLHTRFVHSRSVGFLTTDLQDTRTKNKNTRAALLSRPTTLCSSGCVVKKPGDPHCTNLRKNIVRSWARKSATAK